MANESSNNNGTNSPVVSLFQKAHQRMVMLGRMDEQLASLFDQRKKLFEELRDIQYSINEQFEKVMELADETPAAAAMRIADEVKSNVNGARSFSRAPIGETEDVQM